MILKFSCGFDSHENLVFYSCGSSTTRITRTRSELKELCINEEFWNKWKKRLGLAPRKKIMGGGMNRVMHPEMCQRKATNIYKHFFQKNWASEWFCCAWRMQLCVQKITFHILVFDVPLQYFLPSKSIQFEVPEAGFWSEDPITNSIYFIKFDTRTTELYKFDTFTEFREARFNSLKPSVSLTGTQLFL